MNEIEYLVSFGRAGDFGRFRSASLPCCRGDRVVVRTEQGVELGVVLCAADAGHAHYLSRTAAGELLRLVTAEDEQTAESASARSQAIFEHARSLAAQLELPLEIIDVDVLLDGRHAVVYHLRRESCDHRALVSNIARAFDVHVLMQNLFVPTEPAHGCGEPNCGGGNCSSCGSGGCGTCGKGTKPDDVAALLARMVPDTRYPLL